MIEIEGIWWPDDVGEKWKHSFRHVGSLEWAIKRCKQRRTAVQAGGNIGLWPRRMAKSFERVITFEPDAISRECLVRNVPGNVTVYDKAVGHEPGHCSISHRSLGSHNVAEGDGVEIVTIDSLELTDVDLLQLDIEGYEWHALWGATETIERSSPIIQIEMREFTQKYGHSDDDVRALLKALRYTQVSQQPGSDFVYQRL